VKERKEAREVQEVNEVKEREGSIAAFFDLDGTLMALPSLEKRFFRMLRYRKAISAENYFLWLREAMRLMPRGISAIWQANKMYLRGVQIFEERGERDGDVSAWEKEGPRGEGQAPDSLRRDPRLLVLTFFVQAIERVAWHAKQGHEIVLVSGTLEPLARGAARALEAELAARGSAVTIRVLATRLEEGNGQWTGRVSGEAMFGEAKARAAERVAEELGLHLRRCYAYGDSLHDRWLLAVVGRPAAVNPTEDLASMARKQGWAILRWKEKENLTQRRRGQREIVEKREQSGAIA
jgi:HAD superfamily phosphoserine phosphatase-like hydrolase